MQQGPWDQSLTQSPTVFDKHGIERLTEWRKFRDQLETHEQPLHAVADFWARAPFVSPFLKPYYSKSWPDPWALILDGKFDRLAIVLGMLYTLQLTDRFSKEAFEIYMSVDSKESEYYLLVGDKVLNLEYRSVVDSNQLFSKQINKIYPPAPKQ